ncbi:MAG TPA: SusC/RagA family TonB-linked outer membrane protein, partial [Gemmatimonadaceae bacterium]|nr:SusC/RagA family TonB-linked outer membrane protein [Gemmatimonadaceae bacterium]
STEELGKNVVNSLQQGLQGRIAGVQVTQGDAAPGAGIRVQVRGTNSMNPGSATPLYVIDGVPIGSGASKRNIGARSEENLTSLTETNPLASISPADIESIDILKDASATAIYGSRGANGVVIVTTKRGRTGRGELTMNYSQGYQDVVREIPVLNAYEFASYVNQAFINAFGPQTEYPYGGRVGSKTPEQIRQEMGAGTNWQKQIFQTAPLRELQLNFGGGDDNGSYVISSSLLDQSGVIKGSQFRRGGARINLDRSMSEWLRVSSNLSITRSLNDMVRSSTINGWRAVGIVRQALMYVPFQWRDTTQADPRAEDATTWSNYGANPLRYTDEVSEQDQQTNGVGGIRAVAQLGRGFALDFNMGAYYNRRTYATYYPRTVNEGRAANGLAVQAGDEYSNIVSDNLLRWNREIGSQHRFDAVGGFSFTSDRSTWSGQEVHNFPDDILGSNVLGNGTSPQKPYSGLSESKLASWLGRVNYTLADRYSFTATVRADGSSKFAANHKWATFPALAFSWRAKEEAFLRGNDLLSDLKVRLSYGESGNQAIGAYQSLPAIAAGGSMTINEVEVPAYVITQLGNPNLKWETTTQYNAGVDFGFFNGRASGTFDWYHKNTYDLLQNITLSGNTGFSNAWLNSGNVTNRGFEVQLNYNILTGASGDAPLWNVGFNTSRNKNRIESLGPVKQQFAARLGAGGGLEAAPFIQKPGLPIGAMWGYRTNGIVRDAADSAAESALQGKAVRVGDLRYADVSGDGKITAEDQLVIGDANADWVFGFSNRLAWKRFDLSALITAVQGNEIINAERLRYLVMDGSMNIPTEYVTNAFHPDSNPSGKYPQIRQDRKTDNRFHDLYLEDGSYVRVKSLQVGYNLPLRFARSARVYVNAINLYTWTNYTGFDPEVSAFGSPDRPGVDLGNYPQARTITVGLSTTF